MDVAQAIKQKTIDLGFYACNFPESVGAPVCRILNSAWLNASWARLYALTTSGRRRNLDGLREIRSKTLSHPAIRGGKDGCVAMTEARWQV